MTWSIILSYSSLHKPSKGLKSVQISPRSTRPLRLAYEKNTERPCCTLSGVFSTPQSPTLEGTGRQGERKQADERTGEKEAGKLTPSTRG